VKIEPAQITEADETVTVAYRFAAAARADAAGELWFRVPRDYRDWIHSGPEPAVAALTFVAMALGEDIEVAEPVSPRFHYGFHRAVEHFHLWWPQVRPVALHAPGFATAQPPGANAVVSCFSGGVDSFHTLYAHLDGATAHPDFRLTHLFFAHGFDIPLTDPAYDALAAEFAELARPLGLSVVRLATNARRFLDPHIEWQSTHGTVIAAGALLLSGGVRRFIIPSTNRQSTVFATCGSNPITDPLLRTESLDIIHYGTHLSRIQKILAIAERREARAHLRVCWQNVAGARNCGRCVKCLNTMMPLAIVGALPHFPVFPALPPWRTIDRRCFAPFDPSALAPEVGYAEELRALAAAHGCTEFPSRRLLELALRRRLRPLVRLVRRARG